MWKFPLVSKSKKAKKKTNLKKENNLQKKRNYVCMLKQIDHNDDDYDDEVYFFLSFKIKKYTQNWLWKINVANNLWFDDY